MNIRTIKSKISFWSGRNPKIEKLDGSVKRFIPEGFKAVLTITADFELAWAWQYDKKALNNIDFALNKARQARENIPLILDLCDKFNIPITWATVGHLFLESCQKQNGVVHGNLDRIPHFENQYLRFVENDWYQHDPCSNYQEAPEWYAPDLIRKILLEFLAQIGHKKKILFNGK